MNRKFLHWTTWAVIAFAGLGITGAQSDDAYSSEIRPMIDRLAADRGSLTRTYSMTFDPARSQRLTRFYDESLARLEKVNFNSLSQDGRIDYLLLRNYLTHEVSGLALEAKARAETAHYLPFAQAILNLEQKRRAMEPVIAKDAAAALAALNTQIESVKKSVESELSVAPDLESAHRRRVIGNRAAIEVDAWRAALSTWFTYYDGYEPLFTWWAAEAHKTADASLLSYGNFLREKVAGLRTAPVTTVGAPAAALLARAGDTSDIIGDPIGREGLLSELAYEMIPYTPEELIVIGEKEYAWCEKEMKRAAREMGFGDDWKAALEKVKTMYVEPGKQPEMIRDLAREAEKFLADHDLITVPPLALETWRMQMMTPARQLINPFFTGGEVISVSFPTNTMTYEQRLMSMRGNNIPFSRATVFHELIPGHHLQGFMAARYRPYRSPIAGTAFFGEGWSLYWELLLWDLKFQRTAEDRVGALFWRMHRCARIVFSLSFHLGKMTPQQAVDYLVDKVGHERENAIGEVRRSFNSAPGVYGALYQAAYLLGGLQIYSLRQELVDSGKMSNRQFHDALLKESRIPIEMIRASLTRQPLTRGFKSSWRFFDTRRP